MNYNHMSDVWDSLGMAWVCLMLLALVIGLSCARYISRRKRNRYIDRAPTKDATRYTKPGSL